MYLDLTIFTINLACGFSYAAYEMFQGFDVTIPAHNAALTKETSLKLIPVTKKPKLRTNITNSAVDMPTTNTTSQKPYTIIRYTTTPDTPESTPVPPITTFKFNCSEDEHPSNIGPYEVPTQRDLVLLIRKTLIRMYNSYHGKALYLLNDIKEATKATSGVENRCHGHGRNPVAYRRCVKRVGNKCAAITKVLVTSLERQRLDVSAFIDGTICNVTEMKADPVNLIKTLAMEEASLEFALPGFLRLLGACSVYCDKTVYPEEVLKKPLRHMTDQDLVVKHFLTKKSYIQLINGSI